jgi:hydroxymethylglutaryl-CoA reductase
MTDSVTSRIPGFYKKSLRERLARLVETGRLSPESIAFLEAGGGLPADVADRMSENVVGCYGLPMGIALNFRVNNRDVLVPMSVEEPSVVAAASNARAWCA